MSARIPSLYTSVPIAFGGSPKGFDRCLEPLLEKIADGTLKQGDDERCGITCLVGIYDYELLETTLELGKGMATTLESIFEFAPPTWAANNLIEALHAIPIGSNTALAPIELLQRIFVDPEYGVILHTLKFEQHYKAIEAGLDLFEKMMLNLPVTVGEWETVELECARCALDETADPLAIRAIQSMEEAAKIISKDEHDFYYPYEQIFGGALVPYDIFFEKAKAVFATSPLSFSGTRGNELRQLRMDARKLAEVPVLETA